jgi:hypothetical protein
MVPDVDESGYAADAGTALHEGLQEWARSGGDETKAYLTLMQWWPWELEDLRIKQDARTFGNALLLLKELMHAPFWDEWEVAILPDGTHAIELPFRINHTSLGSFIHPRTGRHTYLATQGKMDFIVRNRRSGDLMGLDLKTTLYDEDTQPAQFRFQGQSGQYGMVLSAAVGHDFHTHGINFCYLVGEFSAYGPNVREFKYTLSPEEVEDSIQAKNDRLERILKYARQGWWPRRSHGCVFYGTPCGYLEVCHRRDYEFLMAWFANEADRFKFSQRIYQPYWILEA